MEERTMLEMECEEDRSRRGGWLSERRREREIERE